ncbi:MAG: hypothetical protein ACRDBO_13450 [Lachnospiraceae bacterium]
MKLDLEHVMLLLQRRYHIVQEISRLTDELQEAVSRDDHVSAALLLKIRAEEMENYAACQEKILLLAEQGPKEALAVQKLVLSEPVAPTSSGSFEEQRIYEIRHRTIKLIKQVQDKDRHLNRRVGGEKSYYAETTT